MDTVASNIANINTTRNEQGQPIPYIKKEVVFQTTYQQALNKPEIPTGGYRPTAQAIGDNMMFRGEITYDNAPKSNGVSVQQITESKDPYKLVYEPGHPDADANGFVKMPNINPVTEMMDMMTAARAYESNVTSIESAKSMIRSALKI
jgi:flagellar basal-body rod protein FlgC